MDEFTIYCTPEQTRKALQLGAPIRYASITDIRLNRYINTSKECYALPTAEQMKGWIEAQDAISSIEIEYATTYKMWIYFVYTTKDEDSVYKSLFPSRPEATIAAIDAALEYLTNKK